MSMNDIQVQGHYEIPLVNRGIVSAHSDTLKGSASSTDGTARCGISPSGIAD